MDHLLLGGWRHVAADVRRLVKDLSALPDACTCGPGASHLAGTCCTDCEALLESIRDDMDELVDATLRFLPFVEGQAAAGGDTSESDGVRDLRRKVFSVAGVSQRLETATGEFRLGCGASHVGVLRTLAGQLAAATTGLDARLTAASAHVTSSRVAGA